MALFITFQVRKKQR